MKNHKKLSRIIILCFIAISCISCNKTTDKTERQDINGHTINLNTTQSISQLRNKAAKEMKATAGIWESLVIYMVLMAQTNKTILYRCYT